jgi:hypothetical protein
VTASAPLFLVCSALPVFSAYFGAALREKCAEPVRPIAPSTGKLLKLGELRAGTPGAKGKVAFINGEKKGKRR